MVSPIPQRAYRVVLVGPTEPSPALLQAVARAAGMPGVELASLWPHRPVLGRNLRAEDARKLELRLQAAGAEVVSEPQDRARSARPTPEPASLRPRPSALAAAQAAPTDRTSTRIMAYLAAGFAAATALLLLQ